MAHVHGAKAAEVAKKVVEGAGRPLHAATEMMGEGAGMKHMMGGAMGSMMEHGAGMGAMAHSRAVTAGVATGAAITASTASGHSLLRRILTHPVVLFGAGIAVGYLIHKYREEILQQSGEIDITE
ncbi:hypothetical protein EWI61_07860 [Methylolobus aquaticus]|nr:hypothetical protein EWI61_07860 [Methylolobus aquaticus]